MVNKKNVNYGHVVIGFEIFIFILKKIEKYIFPEPMTK